MTTVNNRHIALLGASFNPPHTGHCAVIDSLLQQATFDEIWLLPVYQHAFGKELLAFDLRLKMTDLLASEFPQGKVKVLTVERDMNRNPTYTYDVVQELKKRHPRVLFSLILGSDIKAELDRWYRCDELQKLVSFYFVPRKGYEESPYPEVSSSDIRQRVQTGFPYEHLTTPRIARFILENNLYQKK